MVQRVLGMACAAVLVACVAGCKTGGPFAPPKCADCAHATCERHQPQPEAATVPGQSPFLPTPRAE